MSFRNQLIDSIVTVSTTEAIEIEGVPTTVAGYQNDGGHFAMVVDEEIMRFYVGGTLMETRYWTRCVELPTVTVSSHNEMNNVAVWARALTPREIATLYALRLNPPFCWSGLDSFDSFRLNDRQPATSTGDRHIGAITLGCPETMPATNHVFHGMLT